MIVADQDNSTRDPARICTAIICHFFNLHVIKRNSSLRLTADQQKIKFLIGTSPMEFHSPALDFLREFRPHDPDSHSIWSVEQLGADPQIIREIWMNSSAVSLHYLIREIKKMASG